jgi:topoisomerase-4 subunit A
VLDANQVPRVMSLAEVLRAYLDHRRDVLQRRTRFRLTEIARRLEILEGYLKAYLNIDAVIRVIRTEDDPTAVMMKKWQLTDLQADAILNMRLRSLRRLEEVEIKTEHKNLTGEQKDLSSLLKSEDKQWDKISGEIADLKKPSGRRPIWAAAAPAGEPSAIVIPSSPWWSASRRGLCSPRAGSAP